MVFMRLAQRGAKRDTLSDAEISAAYANAARIGVAADALTAVLNQPADVFLRNYVEGYGEPGDKADETYQPITVFCPSQSNMVEESAFMQAHRLARFRLSEDRILDPGTRLDVLDRRSLEHWVLYPPDKTTKSAQASEAFLAGITLGVSVLFKEYLTDDGSPIVKHRDKHPPNHNNNDILSTPLRDVLCDGGTSGCAALTPERLEQIEGRWFQRSFISPAPANCAYCTPRRIDYSVRIMQ
jgi:hypothetical protein